MHSYSIDTDARKKVIIGIFIVSILLSTCLTYWLDGIIISLKMQLQQYVLISQLLAISDAFGITTNFIGIPFLYAVLYALFDNILWRCKPFKKIFNIPDLRGHWEGKLTSTTFPVTIDMSLDVRQTWSKISFVSTFPKSTSVSDMASIFVEKNGIVKVGFGFINRSREFLHQYDGYNILEMDNDTHLFGRYFNNRDNSNIGEKSGNIGRFELDKITKSKGD